VKRRARNDAARGTREADEILKVGAAQSQVAIVITGGWKLISSPTKYQQKDYDVK
jgi:hypothetical protein